MNISRMSQSSYQMCYKMLLDLIDQIIGPTTVKPTFVSIRKSEISDSPPAAKFRKIEDDNGQDMLVSNLNYVSRDRDYWRSVADSAKQEGERLAKENNNLVMANKELVDTVEEQSKVCTLLAADLVEIIWSLTNIPEDQPCPVQQFQLLSFLRLAEQAVSQYGDSNGSKQDMRLLSGLLGCLVNLSSRPDTLILLLATEQGRHLVKGTAGLLLVCKEPKVAELVLMMLYNLLGPEMESYQQGTCNDELLSSDMRFKINGAVTRWMVEPMARESLHQLADKVHLLLRQWGEESEVEQ